MGADGQRASSIAFGVEIKTPPRLFLLFGALTPLLFLGSWWLPCAPLGYWFLRRVFALLPTTASIAATKAREQEALFFLAALSGSLKSGLSLLPALATISQLLTSSLKRDINRIYSLLLLGAEPNQAWAPLYNDPQVAQLSRALASAQLEGRSLLAVVERVSTDCYERTLKRSRERVKSLSVKLALPVGLCFLPSFLIGGIGPIIYSFFTSLQIF